MASEMDVLQICTMSKQGVELYAIGGSPNLRKLDFSNRGQFYCAEYSRDGAYLACSVTSEQLSGVRVLNTQTNEVVVEIPEPQVHAVNFSPLNTYLVTWRKPLSKKKPAQSTSTSTEATGTESNDNNVVDNGNLCIWNIKTGAEIIRFHEKMLDKDNWPYIQFSRDEEICARMGKDEVLFYNGKQPGELRHRLQVENLSKFAISQTKKEPHSVAVFAKGKKERPSVVKIYRYPFLSPSATKSTKTFFKCDKADLMWNSTGTCLLVHTRTDFDQSNKNYYGESNLYLQSSDGKFDCNVTLSKEGPIHDVQWHPKGEYFLVIYGLMPAKCGLFDLKANEIFSFGTLPRNSIAFSPSGRFLVIAGFGNLTGDMDFWELAAVNPGNPRGTSGGGQQSSGSNTFVVGGPGSGSPMTIRKIGTSQSSFSAYYAWSPDSRHFITAVITPRMRVNNGFRVFKYNGILEHKQEYTELYEAKWINANEDQFPDRPPSPRALREVQAVEKTEPKAVYRPPSARGSSSISEAFKRKDEEAKVVKPVTTTLYPPGFNPNAQTVVPGQKQPRNKGKAPANNNKPKEVKQQQPTETPKAKKVETKKEDIDVAKEIRTMTQKLRQIEKFKMQKAEGKTLKENQEKLLEEEEDTKQMLDKLNAM